MAEISLDISLPIPKKIGVFGSFFQGQIELGKRSN